MYDTEYIRELTAARKANEVARALIKDHEATIVAQRAELGKLQIVAGNYERVMADAVVLRAATERLHAERDAQRAEAQCAIDAMRGEHDMRVTILRGQIADLDRTIDALRAEVAALRAQVEVR